MALYHDALQDFVKGTLDFFIKRNSWQDLSLDLQEYTFASQVVSNNKVNIRGGEQLQHRVQVRNTGTFRYTGLYDTSGKTVVDHLENLRVPWTKQQVHYVYEEDEVGFQSGPETIIEVLKVRIHSMHNDWFEGMEQAMWTSPSSETQNPRQPYGIPAWIVKSTGSGPEAFGFNGLNGNFSSGIGGLSSSTYPNWANGTGMYGAVTQTDLFDKWSEACHKCYFQAPHSYDESVSGKPRHAYFTTYPVLEACHNQLFASNDNIGVDLGKYRNQVLFKGSPVMWVPALTNSGSGARDTANPIYGIDWSTMGFYFKTGGDRKTIGPIRLEQQPTTHVTYMETWCNFMCLDRRRNFVLHSDDFTMS